MTASKSLGKVQTVSGLIDADDLGITLTHEHCFIDNSVWILEPGKASEKPLVHQPVSLDNLWWVRYHPFSNLDNIRLQDEELTVSELKHFKSAGGSTAVDMSCIGYGRDPRALASIAETTGLNIIMGTGYYVEAQYPPGWQPDEDKIIDEIIRDVTVGVDNTGIRAGVMGQLGIVWPMTDNERLTLRAEALAQKETGVAMKISLGRSPDSAFEALEVLDSAGADLSRVSFDHIDRTIRVHDTRVKLARNGCYLEYSLFGFEGWYPHRMVLSEENQIKGDVPNDAGRIDEIMALIGEGFLNQILISQDHAWKTSLRRYGGPGYAHILNNVVPLMREKGMPEEHIHALLVENPRRFLQFS
jgi:phosphotriesterase-related protein